MYVGLFLICKELQCTGCIFYRCSEQCESHGMARRVQVSCTIKRASSGRQKRDPRVYIRKTYFSIFAVCSVSCNIFFSVFIRYVLLQGFVPYLGPFRFISLIHLSQAFRGFVLSGFENSRGLPENKIRHSDPSVDRTIEIVRQLEQVFESYRMVFNPLNAELNPICYLLALLGAHHFLHVSRIRVKSLTLRLLMSYIYTHTHTHTHIYIYIYIYIYIWGKAMATYP